MAYFPDKTAIKQEIQENVNKFDLSCDHLTTTNFFTPEIAYVRDNTTREKWTNDSGVFARPMPMQLPVMGKAYLSLKTYFVPYRVLSPQWYNFITRSPHVPANGSTPIVVQEMPFFRMNTLQQLFTTSKYSSQLANTATNWDFITYSGNRYKLTAFGRKAKKVLDQCRIKILWGNINKDTAKHYNALRILAFAKIYLDYYYSNQYSYLTSESYDVEAILKKDAGTAYELTSTDFDNIFELTKEVWYSEDYFVSQWDNPVAPNVTNTSFGLIQMPDITITGSSTVQGEVTNEHSNNINEYFTPYLEPSQSVNGLMITQYALDNLKKMSEYCQRYSLSGVRAINRYLSRFGVLLTAEKLQRSEFYGEQVTHMQFGAIMATAETNEGNLGDYAGQGIINSDGQEHKHFELDDLKDMGCIMQIFTINPKIGYWQGMARENFRSDPESYFNGLFDGMGTQATSPAELYVSIDGTGNFSDENYSEGVFGWITRQAHMKLALDNLSGDFTVRSLNNNTLISPWHLFRTFDDSYFNGILGVFHNPAFAKCSDKAQYLRIFNATNEEDADHFIVMIQSKNEAMMHAKAVYDTYDFEGEGKRIIMDGLGPKAN